MANTDDTTRSCETPSNEDPIDTLQRLLSQAHAATIMLQERLDPDSGDNPFRDRIAFRAAWSIQSQLEAASEASRHVFSVTHKVCEPVSHGFTDEDDRILCDVDCMISEAAVTLKFANTEHAKESCEDSPEGRSARGVLKRLEEQLFAIPGSALGMYEGTKVADVDNVLDIIAGHAESLLAQATDVYVHNQMLNSNLDASWLSHSVARLLGDAGKALTALKDRFARGEA